MKNRDDSIVFEKIFLQADLFRKFDLTEEKKRFINLLVYLLYNLLRILY